MNSSLIVDDLNIAELSDDELLQRLQDFGFMAGPILSTTREVYQRKLARLLRNEELDELAGGDSEVNEEDPEANEDDPESPVMNCSYESSYSASPSISFDELRRRPLSRVEGQNWSNDPPILSPHKPWSVDDIVTQVQPPPGEEEKPLVSHTTIAIAFVAIVLFVFFVYYNMESAPQTPFS